MKKYIDRARGDGGDQEAWGHIYLQYSQLVSLTVAKFIFNAGDREDVEQEAWTKIVANISKYSDEFPFEAWLYTLVKRLCFDWIKKRNHYSRANKNAEMPSSEMNVIREVVYMDEYQEDAEEVSFSSDFSDNVILRQAINDALKTIKHKEWVTAFALKYLEGLSYKEISEIMGLPESTLHNWTDRVKKAIKPILSEFVEKNNIG